MWFELRGDQRLGKCTTEGCGGQPTARLESGGVGSDYCSGCRSNIEKIDRASWQRSQYSNDEIYR
jgi:hypothetical protein